MKMKPKKTSTATAIAPNILITFMGTCCMVVRI
jgi:hypothetical protein